MLPADPERKEPSEDGPVQTGPQAKDSLTIGMEIQRPRSALHSGDFSARNSPIESRNTRSSIAQTGPIATSPPRPEPPFHTSLQSLPKPALRLAFPKPVPPKQSSSVRSRAPSLQSGSPSYVLKSPTSPLVRETRNEDTDLEDFVDAESPSRIRRNTLTPIGSLPTTSNYSGLTQAARLPASLRKENTIPWQGYSKRRSLNASWSYQPASSPQPAPFLRSRTSSFSSDASPRQTSMVGSYEESILRGRMSGAPSQPLNFTAELGAVAKNGHKPSCPAHVHVEFPAVYYSWSAGVGRIGSAGQEPSPYVGRIDLEHNLAPPKPKDERRRQRNESVMNELDLLEDAEIDSMETRQKKRKRKENALSDSSLGGCYRIPQQGSLQIIIRNPNKSAAKVFIVPYDLEGMTPGTRTWVRQRCYSAGPIIESPLSSKQTTFPLPSSKSSAKDHKAKPTLRYLIHLKICSPSRSRFYLYDEIRVVFANRVPDNKESLKYEVQMPDPKYTAFRPRSRRSFGSESGSKIDLVETEDIYAFRRRSYNPATALVATGQSLPASASGSQANLPVTPSTPVPAVPYGFASRQRSLTVGTLSEQDTTEAETVSSGSIYLQSPTHDYWDRRILGQVSSPETGKKPMTRESLVNEMVAPTWSGGKPGDESRFAKLKQDDTRYGGLYGRPATPEPGAGLLAMRLRGLDIDEREHQDDA